MKKLFLILMFLPLTSFAQNDSTAEDAEDLPGNSVCEPAQLICGELSDARCFGRPVASLCITDAQRGQTGFCRQRSNLQDGNTVECGCY